MSERNSWSIEDIKEYFGEFFDDEEEMAKVMNEIMGNNYTDKMFKVREYLISKGCSVPFRASYRRFK